MTNDKLRIVLAKVGLDGHDRGMKVVARGLRDAGLHVIYGGIWQSPESVAQTTCDEDAGWLGISLLSGAHLSLMPRVISRLRSDGLEDVGVVLGGILPEDDIPQLRQLGVAAVFGPGTATETIARFLQEHPAADFNSHDLKERFARGDRRALAKLITVAARGQESAAELVDVCTPGRQVLSVAVTGSPGVGKSSLIARLIGHLRSQGKRVAVLACDPESPITGGALLGDRVRMAPVQPDADLFIRSLAVPSGLQGVPLRLDLMVNLLGQFGFDVVLIETVGVGQGDVAVRQVARRVVVLLQPHAGDALQWQKAGVLEIADVVVIQKADLTGTDQMESELRQHLNLPGCAPVPIVRTSAARDEGIVELWSQISQQGSTA